LDGRVVTLVILTFIQRTLHLDKFHGFSEKKHGEMESGHDVISSGTRYASAVRVSRLNNNDPHEEHNMVSWSKVPFPVIRKCKGGHFRSNVRKHYSFVLLSPGRPLSSTYKVPKVLFNMIR